MKQEGYAFVTFEDHQAVERVVANPLHVILGITVVCAKSNRKPKRGLQPNQRVSSPANLGHPHAHVPMSLSNQLTPPGLPLPPSVHHSHSPHVLSTSRFHDRLLADPNNLRGTSPIHLLDHSSLLDPIAVHHSGMHEDTDPALRWRSNSTSSAGLGDAYNPYHSGLYHH
jgi:hypothetical protein